MALGIEDKSATFLLTKHLRNLNKGCAHRPFSVSCAMRNYINLLWKHFRVALMVLIHNGSDVSYWAEPSFSWQAKVHSYLKMPDCLDRLSFVQLVKHNLDPRCLLCVMPDAS